jgi:radical SAM superfamily enzyme YgiQ (UPF0313 family)
LLWQAARISASLSLHRSDMLDRDRRLATGGGVATIVLINPRFQPTYWGLDYALPMFRKRAILPPLNLALLAALTPAEHSVAIIDENVEDIDFERCRQADIVGVTGMAVQRVRMCEIITELKSRGIFTVLGGPWATVSPEDLGPLADVVFIGEAEETWPRFLEEWTEGRHQLRYEQAEKSNMAAVPAPRYDLLPMQKYVYGSLQISRGCPFTCEFCDIIVVFGRRPRLKSARQVIDELNGLVAAGMHDAFIVDDNLIGNKKVVKEILREIIAWQQARGYPMSFVTEASIDLAEDPEMMRLMLEANIDTVFVGIESPNEESLRETKKIQNLADRSGTALEKVHRIQDAGIFVWGGTIVGFDNDGPSVFELQRRFAEQSRIAQMMVQVLFAIPQTPLHKRLAGEGRLRDAFLMSNWGTAAATNVVPLRLSMEELRDGYLKLVRDLYQPDAFFARMDAMCFATGWLPAPGRTNYLRQHPLRRLKLRTRAAVEAFYVFIQLMRAVPDAQLRRRYRQQLMKVLMKRPNPRLVRVYAMLCAAHFHYDRLIAQMAATLPAVAESGADGVAAALPAAVRAPVDQDARAAAD